MLVRSAFLHLTKVWLRGGRWVVVLAALGGLAWVYAGTFWQALPSEVELRSPQDMEVRHLTMTVASRKDQNLDFSHGVSVPLNNWLPHRTDGLVRPLWPWVAAWLMDDADAATASPGYPPRFAQRVHLAKLAFSLSMLMLLGLACARAFSVPAALLTVFLIGFGVFVPSARMFLPDLLFSVLILLTWVTCIAVLKRNSLWLYGMIGFFAALANLAAPTATPLMLVFVLVSTLRWSWGWILEHWKGEGGTTLWIRRNHWLGLIALAVCHLFTVGPMLSYARANLGDATPFHWRWFDTAEELRVWTAAHQPGATSPSIPAGRQPDFDTYRVDHTTEQIRARLSDGAQAVRRIVLNFTWGESCPRGCFAASLVVILLLLLVMLVFIAPRAHHAGQALHPETAPIVLFGLLGLAVITLDFGWDTPVLDFGNRVLALYPPLVLSLVWACEALVQRARRRSMRLPAFFLYQLALWVLCVLAVWWMISFLQPPSPVA